jgi:hypothetical protein
MGFCPGVKEKTCGMSYACGPCKRHAMYKELLTHASLILMWDAQTFLYAFSALATSTY